jgi:hypothetical protein
MERDIEQSAADIAGDRAQPVSLVSERSTTTRQPCQKPGLEEKGRPSVIEAYCRQAIDLKDTESIWFCMQRGRKWIAMDVQPASVAKRLGIEEPRKQDGWWKRHSMFSAVGVKEVKVGYHIESL